MFWCGVWACLGTMRWASFGTVAWAWFDADDHKSALSQDQVSKTNTITQANRRGFHDIVHATRYYSGQYVDTCL
jgi:hypothetical protein